MSLVAPGAPEPTEFPQAGFALSHVPRSPAPTAPVVPVLGPPTAPLLNGMDAYEPRSGVGLQPTFSWSPPRLGIATSYQVIISSLSPPAAGDTVRFSALVYSGNSFKVPPGLLKAGNLYFAQIYARQAPWDVLDHAPFRRGTPFHETNCVTGLFTP